jgi:hypothetical protein
MKKLKKVTQLIENSYIVSVNTFDLQVLDKKLLSEFEGGIKKISLEYDVHIEINEQNINVSVYGFNNQKIDDGRKKIQNVFEKTSSKDLSSYVSTFDEFSSIKKWK